jgi:hypothetical protein
LLSERGFRYLRTHFNDIEFDGPGHEPEDLDKLMLYYREWAHYLFPEMKFSDFTTKTRKECSSRMMKQYLHDLRRDVSQGAARSADFAEVDVGLTEIRDMLSSNKTGGAFEEERAKEKATEEPAQAFPDFSDFSLGDADKFSEEEHLLDEMES